MKCFSYILLFFFFGTSSIAQKPIAADCATPINISIGKLKMYGPTKAPNGYGNDLDLPKAAVSKYFFETEHNTAWYLLKSTVNAKFTFEIVPDTLVDDYDFLLFKIDSTNTNYCDEINQRKLLPIRTNISRVNKEIKGKTGLAMEAESDFATEGPGKAYSKYIDIKKGDRYLLVVDNVYPKGRGHTLIFDYVFSKQKEVIGYQYESKIFPEKTKTIKGRINNEDNKPIKAEVVLEDSSGTEIAKTTSNAITGEYTLTLKQVDYTKKYLLNAYTDSTFIEPKLITFNKEVKTPPDLITVLPQLKKGKKLIVKSLNFFVNSDKILLKSKPSLHSLYRLMKKNKNLKISVEGHVNGNENSQNNKDTIIYYKGYDYTLSVDRAKTVCKYLVENGIDSTRLQLKGWGSKYLISKRIFDENFAPLNRRVEIKVLDY